MLNTLDDTNMRSTMLLAANLKVSVLRVIGGFPPFLSGNLTDKRECIIMIKIDPWEFLITDIFNGKEFCAYGHYVGDTLFYVGSGVIARAFDFGFGKRNEEWHKFCVGRAVTVRIFAQHRTRAESRRMEYDLIARLRPVANETRAQRNRQSATFYETAHPDHLATGIFTLAPTERVVITCEPGGLEFKSIAEAMAATGVSQGAISNSISGRYPMVRGMTFGRAVRPA